MLRMDSWPPREKRSSSFVSVKSAGSGGGYRFENVAGRAMKGTESLDSNSLDRPPNFLQTDPARKTQAPAASTDPARPGTSPKLGSPASLQTDRFERGASSVRPGMHRADSSSSSFGASGSRGLPQTRFSRSSSSSSVSSRPTTSEGTRPRPANGAAFALAAVTTDSPIERPRHVKRPSTHHGRSDRDSVSSMASFASSPHSPGSVSVVPRSSSLRNARMVGPNSASNISSATSAAEMASSQPSPPLPPRMSSTTRSIGKSIDSDNSSSITTIGEASRFDSEREPHTDSKVVDSGGSGSGSRGGYKPKRTSLLDLEARHGPSGLRQAASSAAGAAGAGALAAIRARFGDGTPLKLAKAAPAAVEQDDEEVRDKVSHLRGDDAPTYFDAASPESMKTARAELSPVSTMAINDGGASSISPPDFVTDMGGSLYPVSSYETDIIMREPNGGYNSNSTSTSTTANTTAAHNNNINTNEPQRPQKNPLRFRHPAPMHSPPPPPAPPSSTKPISVGTPSPETLRAIEQRQRMRMALGASPPRRSIEEVAPMGAIMASSLSSTSSYDVENAVTPASPSTLQTGMPIWNEDVKLKPVPATAKRRSKTFRPGSASGLKLEDSPRMHSGSVSGSPMPSASPMMRGSPTTSSQGMERLRTNSLRMRATRASSVDEDANAAAASASQLSLDSNGDVRSLASQEGAAAAAVAAVAAAGAGSTASHGTASVASSSTPTGSATAHRYMSLRKATPPAFGSHKDEQQQQKKTSKWKPFSNDATRDESSPAANSSTSLSFASKLGRKTTKGRKSDPALARPQIRRIFDGQDIDSPGATQSPGIDEQHEQQQQGIHALGEAFRRNGSTPSLGAKTKSNHSLDAASKIGSPGPGAGVGVGATGGVLNSPASVGTPVEELTGEMKRILKRRNVIRELVETEKSYASDLAVVRDVYLTRAKAKAGMSATSILHTPLSAALTSSGSTPIPSPGGSGIGLGPPPPLQPPSSAGILSSALSRSGGLANQRFPSPAIGPSTTTSGTYSPSFASSSDPGNRSSMFTVSSTTSQTSDSSFPFSTANAPPLPATPPTMVAGMTTSASSGQLSQLSQLSSSVSGGTIHGHAAGANAGPSSSSSANLSINAQSATSPQPPPPTPHSAPGRPSVQVSTASHVLMAGALGSPDAPLTPSDIRIIFAHLEQCAVFADEMAAILEGVMGSLALSSASSLRAATGQSSTTATAAAAEEADAEDDRIGRAFLGLMPRIETVYTAYCSRHEASMARLNEVAAHSGRASAFFKDCTEVARKHTNAWDLASLLIKPVQRVLKYPLLIQQIRAATPVSHPDYECLTSALEEIGRVADNINEVKKRKDIAGSIIAGGSRTASTSSSRQRTLTGNEGGYGAGEMVVTTPPAGTKKGKKFKDKSGRLSMLATPTSDHAFDNYATIVERFMTLRRHVEQFAQQVLAWSLNLRDHYEAELRLLTQMRNVMRLRMPPPSDPATAGVPEERRSSSIAPEDEMAVAASLERIRAYQVLIHAIIKTSWRPMHSEIEHNIIPMTDRLLQMFDNPLSVMAKRDEREADYMRFRAMKSDKSLDKRAIESVNGFIALHAQLLDELPQFIFGVLTLLDVGVQAFARIQAAHHLDVRRAVLDYWRVNSPNPNEVTHITAGGEATIKHVHPVRAYWSAHQRTSEILETLRITTPEGHGVFASSAGMPLATMAEVGPEGDGEGGIEGGEDNYGLLAPPMPPLPSFIRSQSANSSPNPSRRPSGVAGLMRTISGTFSKEHSPVPNSPKTPLPTMPASTESLVKAPEGPPLLPSLVFRTEGDDGFFIQNSPIPFLDDDPNGPKKEPYLGNSPAVALLPELLPEVDQATASTMALPPPVPSKTHNDDSLDVQQQQEQKPPMSPRTRQRHKMPVLYTLVANESSSLDSKREEEDRMGWPWLAFESGDKLRVLSTTSKSESNEALAGKEQDEDDETILFGSIDRTGKLGWAERIKFASAASSSPSPWSF